MKLIQSQITNSIFSSIVVLVLVLLNPCAVRGTPQPYRIRGLFFRTPLFIKVTGNDIHRKRWGLPVTDYCERFEVYLPSAHYAILFGFKTELFSPGSLFGQRFFICRKSFVLDNYWLLRAEPSWEIDEFALIRRSLTAAERERIADKLNDALEEMQKKNNMMAQISAAFLFCYGLKFGYFKWMDASVNFFRLNKFNDEFIGSLLKLKHSETPDQILESLRKSKTMLAGFYYEYQTTPLIFIPDWAESIYTYITLRQCLLMVEESWVQAEYISPLKQPYDLPRFHVLKVEPVINESAIMRKRSLEARDEALKQQCRKRKAYMYSFHYALNFGFIKEATVFYRRCFNQMFSKSKLNRIAKYDRSWADPDDNSDSRFSEMSEKLNQLRKHDSLLVRIATAWLFCAGITLDQPPLMSNSLKILNRKPYSTAIMEDLYEVLNSVETRINVAAAVESVLDDLLVEYRKYTESTSKSVIQEKAVVVYNSLHECLSMLKKDIKFSRKEPR